VAVERMERPTADRKDPRSPMHENRALPDGIVARLEALGQQSTAFARAHRDASLGELERGVLDLVRQALPELLGEVIERERTGPFTLAPARALSDLRPADSSPELARTGGDDGLRKGQVRASLVCL
jgi:hypothetical protein